MKNLLFLTSIFFLMTASKCEKDSGNTFSLGETFSLKAGESIKCKNCDNLSLQFVDVKEDSRCPEFTNCVWEGQAIITFSLQSDQSNTLELTSRQGHPQLAKKTMGDYSYTLIKVDPYPKSGTLIKDEEYVLEMTVEKIKS